MNEKVIEINYLDPNMPKIEKVGGKKSDWIDLRSAEEVHLRAGQFKLVGLGVCMKIPDGYEALLAPRSSTFKKYNVIQTNSVGVVDETYCGPDDEWKLPVYALKDTVIPKYDRICQFRIIEHQPEISFKEVDEMSGVNRGGFGHTGSK